MKDYSTEDDESLALEERFLAGDISPQEWKKCKVEIQKKWADKK